MHQHNVLAAMKPEVKIASNKLEGQMKQMSWKWRGILENTKKKAIIIYFVQPVFSE